MELQKIGNFLDITSDNKDLPKFVAKKWIEVYDQSKGNCDINKEIRIKTSMLRSDLCNFSDAYMVVKRTITIVRPNGAKRNKEVTFKNNAPFINCISKVNGVKIDNTEELDVVRRLCITYLNIVKIIKKQQVVYGIIIEINQVILFVLILLNIKTVLQEVLIILVLVKKVMMQIKLVKMKLKLLFH